MTAAQGGLVKQSDAPELLGVSRMTFWRHLRGRLTPYRIGSAVFFRREDLDSVLEQFREGSSQQTVGEGRET